MEEKPKKSRYGNPSSCSMIYSENTQNTFSHRDIQIHSFFHKKYDINPKKIRSSSFSSQMKSFFIKNLVKNTPIKQVSLKTFINSSSKTISVLPTSQELNEKYMKIKTQEQKKNKAKVNKNQTPIKNHRKSNSSALSTNLYFTMSNTGNFNSLASEKIHLRTSSVYPRKRNPSGFQSPCTYKLFNEKSMQSFSNVENGSIASSKKRKTSSCKRNGLQQANLFSKIQGKNDNEINFFDSIKINLLQGTLSKEKAKNILKDSTVKVSALSEEVQKISSKFDMINKNEGEEEAMKIKSNDQNDFIRVSAFSVTEHELNLMMQEFMKPPESKDIELLDSITKRLKFFTKFNKNTRIKLLKTAHLKCYTYGLNLFNEGDEGENMYIIIKGAANVFKKIKDYRTNKTQEILISSLYDGDYFGELAMIGKGKQKHINSLEILENIKCFDDILRQQIEEEQQIRLDQKKDILKKIEELEELKKLGKMLSVEDENFIENYTTENKEKLEQEIKNQQLNMGITKSKRMASVRIAETSYILSLSGENYRNILFFVIKSDLDFKIRILMHLPFFQKYEPYGLIPIANYLNLFTYHLGEIILKENEEIDGLYIVCKGRCKIVKIVYPKITRDLVSSQYSEYLKDFNYSKKITLETNSSPKKRLSSEENNKLPTNCEYIEYKNIGTGECFGGRSLIGFRPKNLYESRNNFIRLDSVKSEVSRLSVVADSKLVEVLKFHISNLCFIPDYLKKNFFNGLCDLKEYDDYDIKKDENERICWDTYKYNVENKIIAKAIINKNVYKPF